MATKLKCCLCNDVIESKGHRHNFVSCSCGETYCDGGDEYSRAGGRKFWMWDYNKNDWSYYYSEDDDEGLLEKE